MQRAMPGALSARNNYRNLRLTFAVRWHTIRARIDREPDQRQSPLKNCAPNRAK
jgi:hypothetical protein